MSEMERREFGLPDVLRDVKREIEQARRARGYQHERQSYTRLPDGTTIQLYERTTIWEIES